MKICYTAKIMWDGFKTIPVAASNVTDFRTKLTSAMITYINFCESNARRCFGDDPETLAERLSEIEGYHNILETDGVESCIVHMESDCYVDVIMEMKIVADGVTELYYNHNTNSFNSNKAYYKLNWEERNTPITL